MIAEYEDVRDALQALTDHRQARIRTNALALMAFGLVIVYADPGLWRTFGTVATLAGIMMLVLMVLGWFDIERRQVEIAVEALENAGYDDAALLLLWDEMIVRVRLSDTGLTPSRTALVTLCAIEALRERRRLGQ